MYVCMYITAFASIPSNRNRGYFLFRAESHVSVGEEVWKQLKVLRIPMTKADFSQNTWTNSWNFETL